MINNVLFKIKKIENDSNYGLYLNIDYYEQEFTWNNS